MAWFLLTLAGLLEIAFALSMKYSEGFTRLVPSLVTVVTGLTSVLLLSMSLRSLPVGTGYAVWTGIGAAGTVIIGILFFKEPADFWRLFFIVTLIASIVGLKFVSN
jgi:quaternary ammonium compound-resistance protein SugE